MSELNNKKDKTFLLVLIYLIMAILITTFAIIFHQKNGIGIIEYFSKENSLKNYENNNKVIEETSEKEEIDFNDIKRVNLSDTFKCNNLDIKYETYEYGDEFYEITGYSYRKISINYFQISGLKDKEIENKINKLIEEKITNLLPPEEVKSDEISRIIINLWDYGNYSNLLSSYINKYIEYTDGTSKDIQYGMNINLITGEEIAFEDLFTPDASIKNIITQSAYNSICKNIKAEFFDTGTFILEDEIVDYSQVENLSCKVLKEVETNSEKNFYFTNFSIYLITSLGNIEIAMIDFYEYINIFNIARSEESLYENGDKQENIYVFGEDYSGGMIFDGKISDYIYLTVYSYEKNSALYYVEDEEKEENEKDVKRYEDNLDKMKECLINYEKSLETNKGAFYNINASYYDENGEIIFCCQRVEVEKTNFNQNIEKIQQNASRELIQAELIFNIGNYEDIETYELVLKDDKMSIREYALEF